MDDLLNLDDEELRQMAVNGDTRAEGQLISRYSRLVKVCARPYFLAGGDSEDLIQEGMMGLLSAIRQYDPNGGASFRVYSETCIKRRLFTAIKSASRSKHAPLNNSVSLDSASFDESPVQAAYFLRDLEEQVLARECADEIRGGFTLCLSEFEAEILRLFLEGLSYQEMACRIHKSQKSVDNAVQRIRKKLVHYLKVGDIS